MPLKQYKPTSPGRRFMSSPDFSGLTKKKPERSLTKPLHKSGGRNSLGHTTIWFRGGGHKRRYRVIDFRRDKANIPARVAAIEYDPNRSARIALLHYIDGDWIAGPPRLEDERKDQLVLIADGDARGVGQTPGRGPQDLDILEVLRA